MALIYALTLQSERHPFLFPHWLSHFCVFIFIFFSWLPGVYHLKFVGEWNIYWIFPAPCVSDETFYVAVSWDKNTPPSDLSSARCPAALSSPSPSGTEMWAAFVSSQWRELSIFFLSGSNWFLHPVSHDRFWEEEETQLALCYSACFMCTFSAMLPQPFLCSRLVRHWLLRNASPSPLFFLLRTRAFHILLRCPLQFPKSSRSYLPLNWIKIHMHLSLICPFHHRYHTQHAGLRATCTFNTRGLTHGD